MTFQGAAAAALLGMLLAKHSGDLAGQVDSTVVVQPKAPPGAEFRLPFASLLAPGTGQYRYGKVEAGVAFSTAALGGVGLYLSGDREVIESDFLSRHAKGQQAIAGLLLANWGGYLSAYDAFRRALPRLEAEGKYGFLTNHEPLSRVLSAPFEWRFLGHWTTWVHLAYIAGIAGLVTAKGTAPGKVYEPFKFRDGAFIAAIGFMPATGEEALFRGWLYPVLYQRFRHRFWLANSVQASIFGAAHLPQAGAFASAISLWAFYEGWLT